MKPNVTNEQTLIDFSIKYLLKNYVQLWGLLSGFFIDTITKNCVKNICTNFCLLMLLENRKYTMKQSRDNKILVKFAFNGFFKDFLTYFVSNCLKILFR